MFIDGLPRQSFNDKENVWRVRCYLLSKCGKGSGDKDIHI